MKKIIAIFIAATLFAGCTTQELFGAVLSELEEEMQQSSSETEQSSSENESESSNAEDASQTDNSEYSDPPSEPEYDGPAGLNPPLKSADALLIDELPYYLSDLETLHYTLNPEQQAITADPAVLTKVLQALHDGELMFDYSDAYNNGAYALVGYSGYVA